LTEYRRRQQLEAKVDSLVALLENVVPEGRIPSTAPAINPAAECSANINVTGAANLPRSESVPANTSSTAIGTTSTSPSSADDSLDLIAAGFISLKRAADLFAVYRQDLMLEFPFVTFSPSENVATLRKERPLLLQSILAVSLFRDSPLQRKVGNEVLRMIRLKMELKSNYSLDLLQAILVYVAWYQYFINVASHQYYLTIQYCMNLVYELGLERNPNEKRKNLAVQGGWFNTEQCSQSERNRALLGTFYVASS
jgi:hypothetical protein